ncbi:hypothetical protein CDAR_433821 [Caerostris darwini]|uniref:Ycf1 n=1 Tax=Caerostris darwini TaxID=1538125 RepID=A0AAV4SSQ9_9ARAC|nr:hypothetical protein CDAR_433821 [Caerostris darwini]
MIRPIWSPSISSPHSVASPELFRNLSISYDYLVARRKDKNAIRSIENSKRFVNPNRESTDLEKSNYIYPESVCLQRRSQIPEEFQRLNKSNEF